MGKNELVNKHYDVGIVGWWFASNYGSALTYYALGKILEDRGISSIMLQISKINRTPWEPETKKTVDFISKYFPISDNRPIENNPTYNDLCDTFMLGSDQLWTKPYIDLLGYTFFLDFVDNSKKKIAYSTSFGNATFNGTKEQNEYIHQLLQAFDYISVREQSGIEACKTAFGLDVKRDLDPVFLCDISHYDKLADSCGKLEPDDNYILSYILDVTEEKQKAIQYVAKKLNARIISILDMKSVKKQKGDWHIGDLKEDASIEEFIYYIKHCKMLITDSHHGACFGMIYNKQLITIPNARRGLTRFTHLFNLFNMNNRLLSDVSEIYDKRFLFSNFDYSKFNKILRDEKSKSFDRFLEALNTPRNKDKIDLPKSKSILNYENKTLNSNVGTGTLTNSMELPSDFVKIKLLVTLLRDYNIKHIVLSPGGRDVPIVRMFEYNNENFILHRVTDERSAAYFALGIAAQIQQPVVCVCTSGTAVSNYLPAVTEAYYTGVPLIMVTADRREVYLNHGEDQTIPQKNIFDGVIKKSVSIPEATGNMAEYQTRRDISDCILECVHNGMGPVHINISIMDINVGSKFDKNEWKLLPNIYPHILRVSTSDNKKQIMKWVNALKNSKKILVVYGQNPPPTEEQKNYIELFATKFNCVIVTDHISNLDCMYSISPYNMLTSISNKEFNDKLSPDILVTVGGKRLMNDPLTNKVRHGQKNIRHWSVVPDGKIKDFYFKLTSVLEMTQDFFFEYFSTNSGDIINDGVYYESWRQMNSKYKSPIIETFTSNYIQSKFLPQIPSHSILHLGVGQSFFECRKYAIDSTISIFCNMGTNGIDGCTSTFMGQCSVVKDKLCFLLVGDLSFFYDMNAIWNKELNKNIRILMVNNNGTGLLRGHGLKAITSVHNTSAKGWVESTGFSYMSANSKEEFDEKLNFFVSDKSEKALFFEVFCN